MAVGTEYVGALIPHVARGGGGGVGGRVAAEDAMFDVYCVVKDP